LQQFYPAEDVNVVRARLGLPDNCRLLLFAGRLEPLKGVDVALDALRLMRLEKAFLLSNLRLVALEAMGCGTLVVASGVGGLAYLIPDGKAGWLIPARDSRVLAERLEFLVMNPEIRRGLVLSAAQLAQQYGWARVVEQLLRVFQGCVLNVASPRKS
jgi:glycosyltransferase involved in cell wall biosynthesis